MNEDPFFTLHRDIPRQGPGTPEDVLWVLDQIDPPARIIDAGCGPGADIEAFAANLPKVEVDGFDIVPHFVEEARDRLSCFGPRVRVWCGDMEEIIGPADLIWSAGAVYFLGIETALARWRAALAPGGVIAFSEPVFLTDPPSKAAAAFWADCPGVGMADKIATRVESAGFRTRATRLITGRAWLDYYLPLMSRAARLRIGAGPDLARELDAAEDEFAGWRAAPTDIAYLLSVVEPA
ncbi:class I SAM-dependent methyltransferase [Defluviimonas aestuarii]|uniref:class I SAM-dependent methyltransferase n=1 Tax=Albidovulum aestuarii TaxID=1130726 RepID=UPI00249A6734|nr:class I SAM-dependent methyltransferase [Defluviimonas aestuarii]MDI3337443.1 class I SAM-dependent methyltransferase [Defluviimonas aestuarii]